MPTKSQEFQGRVTGTVTETDHISQRQVCSDEKMPLNNLTIKKPLGLPQQGQFLQNNRGGNQTWWGVQEAEEMETKNVS